MYGRQYVSTLLSADWITLSNVLRLGIPTVRKYIIVRHGNSQKVNINQNVILPRPISSHNDPRLFFVFFSFSFHIK